jgi:hypothetical protein
VCATGSHVPIPACAEWAALHHEGGARSRKVPQGEATQHLDAGTSTVGLGFWQRKREARVRPCCLGFSIADPMPNTCSQGHVSIFESLSAEIAHPTTQRRSSGTRMEGKFEGTLPRDSLKLEMSVGEASSRFVQRRAVSSESRVSGTPSLHIGNSAFSAKKCERPQNSSEVE